MTFTISRTDLARKTREILEQVRRGQTALIESYGQQQAVLLDALDYRLLRGLAERALGEKTEGEEPRLRELLDGYLREEVSLGKLAESLEVSRFELMERLDRLGVPLELGPRALDEARAEVRSARRHSVASR